MNATDRILVSIDPGIDRAAAAIWIDRPAGRLALNVDGLATHLRAVRECHTEPGFQLGTRLSQLTDWAGLLVQDVRHLLQLGNLIAVGDRCSVVVEWPAFAGMFRGRTRQRSKLVQPNAEAMGKLYAATGAIIGGVSRWCVHVVAQPASKVPRETKQLVGRRALDRFNAGDLAASQKLPNNDDVRSAVFIGLQTLGSGA